MSKWDLRFRARRLPVIALVCCGIISFFFCLTALRSHEAERANAAFQRAAQRRFDDLEADLDLAVNKVVALGAFCETSYPVTRATFESFTRPLLAGNDPAIQALEWAPRVERRSRDAFESSIRAEGIKRFEIRDSLETGVLGRAGGREVYYPVTYIMPMAGNITAEGYDDLERNLQRRSTITSAYTNRRLTASARVFLIQETGSQYGILIYRPVYGKARNSPAPEDLLGFAAGVMRIGQVVEKHGGNSGVAVVVTDVTDGAGEQIYPFGDLPLSPSAFTQQRRISFGGRTWLLTAAPMPGAFRVVHTFSYVGSLLVFLSCMLLAGYVANAHKRRWEVERLVEERTRELNTALTSLAKAHSGLEESEARYRGLVEDFPEAIFVIRQDEVVFANRAALEMFNLASVADLEGYTMLDFVSAEFREGSLDRLRRLKSHPVHLPAREMRLVRRDGRTLDIDAASSSFFHQGSILIQVVVRDISKRKQIEAVTARLIHAIEQVGESIVITDPEFRIVYVNPAFERVSGYSRDEVLGQTPRITHSSHQNDEFYAHLRGTIRNGEIWSGRIVNCAKSGRLYTEEVTISPVFGQSGSIINYVSVMRDVTMVNELQEQLHQSQKMDAIGRLAGGVAHDFNNMLMVISSYAELIANDLPSDHPGQKYTEQILNATQRSCSLTRQLLAFSRKQVLMPQILDCNRVIAETSGMVRRLITEAIHLECELAPDLWPVKADADQIVQVILNLCVNSRDAMPDGGSLTLSTRNCDVDKGFIEISVADTGIGIAAELHEKVFEPFFTTKPAGKGTGLGLATVYGIVQQSGGTIRVESSPGNGATFTVQLPRCMEAASEPECSKQRSYASGTSRVLVVEDEDSLREAIAEHLRDQGYQVLASSDGLQALDLLSDNPDISILVTDIVMPGMGGQQLARLALTRSPRLQVIFMCGYADQAFDEGLDDTAMFLQKPFTMNLLMTRIAELSVPPGAVLAPDPETESLSRLQ